MGFVELHTSAWERGLAYKKEPQDFYVLWSCFLLCFTDIFICNLAYYWHTNGFLEKTKVP